MVPTKSALKALVAEAPEAVVMEGTSFMGPQYNGPLDEAPRGNTYQAVGPDPWNSRKWYASIKWNSKSEKWVVS